MTRISEAVGFNTLRTFNRAFTKQMGVSPTEYRRGKESASPSHVSFSARKQLERPSPSVRLGTPLAKKKD